MIDVMVVSSVHVNSQYVIFMNPGEYTFISSEWIKHIRKTQKRERRKGKTLTE